MATISNTPRPGYVWDATDNVWYPIGVGAHQHTNAADTPAVMPYSTYDAAGKNKILNGDFSIWQRGTTFTNPTNATFTSDRWRSGFETDLPPSYEITRQTFTPGNEPVSGYNSQYFLRAILTTVGACTKIRIQQRIENVGTFANKTVTVSFYAKSDSNRTQTVGMEQLFGSGGSTAVVLTEQTINTTTAWQRFSLQFAVPSISGKTIGTGSSTQVTINQNLTNGNTLDIWGIQAEAGSNVTAFETATGNPASELAACQRYYARFGAKSGGTANVYSIYGMGVTLSTTTARVSIPLPVEMRVAPTSVDWGNLAVNDVTNALFVPSAIGVDSGTNHNLALGVSCTISGATDDRYVSLINNNNANGFIAASAEL